MCPLQVVSSSIVDKYIGESARLIREMFNYARDHQPCIIFMDEIDAIGELNTSVQCNSELCVLLLLLLIGLVDVTEREGLETFRTLMS